MQWLNDLKACPTPKAIYITNDFQFLSEAGRMADEKRSESGTGRCLHPRFLSCPVDWSSELLKIYQTEEVLTFGSAGNKTNERRNHRKACVRLYI